MRADFFSQNTKYNLSFKQIKGELSERKLKSGVFSHKGEEVCLYSRLCFTELFMFCLSRCALSKPNKVFETDTPKIKGIQN